MSTTARIGIFYHSDPAGHVPSGVDSFIRGILQWAPEDLHYTLYGATSDESARPVGVRTALPLGQRSGEVVPLVDISATAGKPLVPNTLRYMRGLSEWVRDGRLRDLDVLDFHRIEPLWLLRGDARPRNLVLHQDMSVLREPGCDIAWRHAPWLYELIERRSFAMAERVSVVRESAVTRYRALYPESADKFRFLPTWYDTSTFGWSADSASSATAREQLRVRYGIPRDRRLLVSVGRLDRQKDPLLLLQSVQWLLEQHRPVHLLMVGDGVLRAAVEAASGAAPLRGHVTLAGALPRTEIAATLRAADVFVMSSAYEGMPIAVLEALACGVPVASTDVGELRRIVKDGINGKLAAERTPASLAAAIAESLDHHAQWSGRSSHLSVAAYRPEQVLGGLYDLHRAQAQRWKAAA